MKADDPRHGTRNGYKNGCREECCRTPHRAALKLYRMGRTPKLIDPTGTRRRIEALFAMGYSSMAVSQAAGRTSRNWAHEVRAEARVTETTAARIAQVYENLRRTEPTGPYTNRQRIMARRNGYALPNAWLHIDDPADKPDPGYSEGRTRDEFDEIVVDRILAGDMTLTRSATKAEKVVVVARWRADGRSLNELERLSGWQARRYLEEEVA